MNSIFTHLFIVFTLGLLNNLAFSQTTFNYTGAAQTYTVPAGVTCISVDVRGAQGGANQNGTASGGLGGRVTAIIPVTAGEVLQVNVGGQASTFTGGWNGGGTGGALASGSGNRRGGGGGGKSDIRRTPYTFNSTLALVVAGGGGGTGGARIISLGPGTGGGGGGGWFGGGGGGGYGGAGGGGGTPAAGGAGGAGANGGGSGTAGAAGTGGNGGTTAASAQAANSIGSAGGSGGNTTGAAGVTGPSWTGGTGGGGSSFAHSSALSVVHTQGVQAGNGQVIITPIAAPTITSFTPTTACPGTGATVVITGTNFTGATAVTFGGTAATAFTVNSATQITATLGAGSTGTIAVTTCAGTGTSAGTFTVGVVPTAVTVSTAGTYCTNTTLTTSGGAGGQIHYQGTTTNGTTQNSITSQLVSASGTYYFRALSSNGCWGTQGSAAVTINAPVVITTQPTALTLCSNGSGTMTVAGTGTGLTYQWRRNGTNLSNGAPYSGVTTATLTITNPTVAAAGSFDCVVSGTAPCTAVTSTAVALTVNQASIAPTALVATPTAICNPGSSTLTQTGGTLGTGATWRWYSNSTYTTLVGSSVSSNGSLSVSPTVTTTYWLRAEGTTTPCVANVAGPVAGRVVTVNQPVVITGQPTDLTLCSNGTGSRTVTATGTGLTYQWRRNGTNLTNVAPYSGVTTATLTITNPTVAAAGSFDCVVSGTAPCTAVTSTAFTLTVNQASIAPTALVATPTAICNPGSSTLTQTGGTLGTGATWRWYSDNTYTTLVGSSVSSNGSLSVSPTVTTTYWLRAEGTATPCVANVAGPVAGRVVTVNQPVVITTQPTALTLCSNGSGTMTVAGTGTGLTYQWRRNGTNLTNVAPYSGVTTATLTITNPTVAAAGSFDCVVSGTAPCTAVTSTAVALTVNQASIAPTTLVATPVTICNGGSSTLTQTGGTIGTGATWRWYSDNTYTTLVGVGAGATASLVVSPTTTTTYWLRAEGTTAPCVADVTGPGAGRLVTVNQPVAITTQPTALTLCTNTSGTMTVAATGTGLTYQWRRNGTNLTNVAPYSGVTTATLTITNPTVAAAGSFDCVVSGTAPCTAVTSTAVSLTVNQASIAPTALVATPTTMCSTGSSTLTQTGGTLGTGATWRWYSDNTYTTLVGVGTGATASLIVNPSATTTYWLRAEGTNSPCTSNITGPVAGITVTVNQAVTISSVTSSATLPMCAGSTTTLTANGVSGTGATVTWYTGAGGTGNNLGTGATKVVGPGQTYYARVTGTGGICTAVEASLDVTIETTVPTGITASNISLYNSPNNGCKTAGLIAPVTASDNCTGEVAATINPVTAITGLTLWTKADAGVVISSNGTSVAEWRDLSGSGNHFRQATFTNRPTKIASSASFNGNPAIGFTTTQFMTGINSMGAGNVTYTMFTVSRQNGGTNARLISSASTNWLLGYHSAQKNKLHPNCWVYDPAVASDADAHMYSVSSNGVVASGTTLYDYGVALATGTACTPNGPGIIQLNGYNNALTQPSTGEIAEIIYYNRVLTLAERQIIEGYLAHKYNLQVPLASMQAYQTFATTGSAINVNLLSTDQAGNTATATATVTGNNYPGATVTPSTTNPCATGTVTLTLSGMAPSGNALTCDASAEYMSIASNPVIGANWTLESWVKFPLSTVPGTTAGSSWNTLFRGANNHHIIVARNGAIFTLGTYVGGFYPCSNIGTLNTYTANEGFNVATLSAGWHHIAAVGSGTTTSFYVDGIFVGKSAAKSTENIVTVGNYSGGGQCTGDMDEVRIWNTALTQNQISNYMTQGLTSSHPNWANLVSYYKFDGNTADSKGSSPGTLSGATVSSPVNFYTYTVTNGIGGTLAPASGNFPTINSSNGVETFTITSPTTNGSVSFVARANTCNSSSTSSGAITINATPVNINPTVVDATICNSASTIIQIAGSESGISYQLRVHPANTLVGSPVIGNTGTIDLPTGNLTTTTTFNVLATNTTSGCTRQMTNTVTVTVLTDITGATFTYTNPTGCSSTGTLTVVGASGGSGSYYYSTTSTNGVNGTWTNTNGLFTGMAQNTAGGEVWIRNQSAPECPVYLGDYVTARPPSPLPAPFTDATPDNLCDGNIVTLTAWGMAPGNGGNGGNGAAGPPAQPALPTQGAYTFNGTTNYLANNATAANLPTGSTITVEAWIRANAQNNTNWNGIVAWGPKTTAGSSFAMCLSSNGRLQLYTWGNNFSPTTGASVPLTNVWTHVAITLNGSTVTTYINGAVAATGSITTPAVTAAAGNWLTIGCRDNPGTYFNGSIDNVRIWQGVRTQAEISADMYKDIPTTGTISSATLKANYLFNLGVLTNNGPGTVLALNVNNATQSYPQAYRYNWTGANNTGDNPPTNLVYEKYVVGPLQGISNYTCIATITPNFNCTGTSSTLGDALVNDFTTTPFASTYATSGSAQGITIPVAPSSGSIIGRPGGVTYSYTHALNTTTGAGGCTNWGLPIRLDNVVGVGANSTLATTDLDYYTGSPTDLINGIVAFRGTMVVPSGWFFASGYGSTPAVNIPVQLVFTVKTSGGAAIRGDYVSSGDIMFRITGNFTVKAELTGVPPSGMQYDGGISGGNGGGGTSCTTIANNTNAGIYYSLTDIYDCMATTGTAPSLQSTFNFDKFPKLDFTCTGCSSPSAGTDFKICWGGTPASALTLQGNTGSIPLGTTNCGGLSHSWTRLNPSGPTVINGTWSTADGTGSPTPPAITATATTAATAGTTYMYTVSSGASNICYGSGNVVVSQNTPIADPTNFPVVPFGTSNTTTWTGVAPDEWDPPSNTGGDNWQDNRNWTHCVPTSTVNALIEYNATNQPKLSTVNGAANAMKINTPAGAKVTIAAPAAKIVVTY